MEFKLNILSEYVVEIDESELKSQIGEYLDTKYDLKASFYQGPTKEDQIEYVRHVCTEIARNGEQSYIPFCGFVMVNGEKFEVGDRVGRVNEFVNLKKKNIGKEYNYYVNGESVLIEDNKGMCKITFSGRGENE